MDSELQQLQYKKNLTSQKNYKIKNTNRKN